MPSNAKRFYIVRGDEQAVIKSVPVSVCAAPPRVDLSNQNEAPAGANAAPVVPHRSEFSAAVRIGRVGRAAGLFHRPHLPHIGRSSR